MATITKGNFCFSDGRHGTKDGQSLPDDKVPNGSTIEGGNFSQLVPDTPILVGKTFEINGGNFVNVRRDPAWTINGGNWTQVARCSNLHPDLIEHGLAECAENCVHVVKTDKVKGRGAASITVYHYADTVI